MRPRTWALLAIGGIVAYVAIDVLLVFLRPELSVLHSAESDYGSKGHWGWVMNVNFLLRCAFSIAVVLALGVRIGASRVLLLVWAIASGLLAFFPDDPAGTPETHAGKIHVLLAFVAFVAVIVGVRMATRMLQPDPEWQPVIGVLTVLSWSAVVPILLLGRTRLRQGSLGGLYEKIFLGMEIGWMLIAAIWVAFATDVAT